MSAILNSTTAMAHAFGTGVSGIEYMFFAGVISMIALSVLEFLEHRARMNRYMREKDVEKETGGNATGGNAK